MVPFFSGSRPLALKLSSKSHQMTTYFIRNSEVFTKMNSIFSQYSSWIRKVFIWWLFSDNLRARGQEPEKKETTNSATKSLEQPWSVSIEVSNYLSIDSMAVGIHAGLATESFQCTLSYSQTFVKNFSGKWAFIWFEKLYDILGNVIYHVLLLIYVEKYSICSKHNSQSKNYNHFQK